MQRSKETRREWGFTAGLASPGLASPCLALELELELEGGGEGGAPLSRPRGGHRCSKKRERGEGLVESKRRRREASKKGGERGKERRELLLKCEMCRAVQLVVSVVEATRSLVPLQLVTGAVVRIG